MSSAVHASPPYRDLIRARIAAGWEPSEAATEPFLPRARLTRAEVTIIRSSQASAEQLAHQLQISPRQVRRIRAGQAWKE